MEEIITLRKKFEEIKEIGWYESKYKGTGAAGNTFERLLGKSNDSYCYPDYMGIEIKTKLINSKYEISLFTCSPNMSNKFNYISIINKFGYPSRKNERMKIFNLEVDAVNYYRQGYLKKFKLIISDSEEKVFLKYINQQSKEVDTSLYWNYSALKRCLDIKLSVLAIVLVDRIYIKGKEYFYYNNLSFYRYRGFDSFIQLLKEGVIKVKFHYGLFATENNCGKIHNHGVSYVINENDIIKLFDKIEE